MKTDIQVPAGGAPFKPLVVGAPRSGFALLASVLIHFVPLAPRKSTITQEVLNSLIDGIGDILSESIVREFAANGITDDLIYNPNFRRMAGGPRWLREDNVELACFRKYIGVRGLGDFTLVTSHPRQVLDVDEVVHSHTAPGLWLRHPGYADYTKFASLRNPVGILNSSVFSINALASEYIQRFVPRDRDNDLLRQQLALYKLTDLDFVRGLVRFLVGYLEEFVRHWRAYHVMRWEDLIVSPVPTILKLAANAGIPLREAEAARMWSRLDHVNLTGHHRHNYREGKGIVGNWRQWLVNEHLELFTSMGLEPLMLELGYGRMPTLNERDYTPFQHRVKELIAAGRIGKETEDENLFTFAFNKSNISSEAFPFKRRDWRTWTRIERSIFADETLEQRISDVAEELAGRLNAVFSRFVSRQYDDIADLSAALDQIERDHADTFSLAPARAAAAFERARHALRRAADGGRRSAIAPAVPYYLQPILVESLDGYNVVAYQEAYYGIPQSMGDFRLDEKVKDLDERVVRGSTRAEVVAAIEHRVGARGSRDVVPPSPPAARRARLEFAEPVPELFAAKCRRYLREGSRKILLTPFNEFARAVYEQLAADPDQAGARVLVAPGDAGAPPQVQAASTSDADLIVVCAQEEAEVSAALMALVDVRTAAVLAPRTRRFWADNPLFLISIPKAGTHLLYTLAKAVGYTPTVVLQDDPAPGAWYCVEFSNSHTVARDFFVDTVRRSFFGNRHHPFMRSPALFIYRNPLDIVASEASYYHKDGNTAFAGYLSTLTPGERLLRLIDDPWLLGSIRDRVGGFLPWLDLPNVIPVSFEELVGEKGGGSADAQRQVIWSLQLKLHVPGDPETLSGRLFDPSSPTFDMSRIGRYREAFSQEAYRRFFSLPQDFMAAYGYEGSGPDKVVALPSRRDEFRRRPLGVSQFRPEAPINVQSGYFGFNIVLYRDCYIAVRQSDGDLDLAASDLDELASVGRIVRAPTAEEARRGIERLALAVVADGERGQAGFRP